MNQKKMHFPGFGGEHINFFVRLTGRFSQGQLAGSPRVNPDHDLSKVYVHVPFSLPNSGKKTSTSWMQAVGLEHSYYVTKCWLEGRRLRSGMTHDAHPLEKLCVARWQAQGKIQARKKSTKINFLGPETARSGGGLPCEGVGVEKFVPSLESLSSFGFEGRDLGCPKNFAGMLQ